MNLIPVVIIILISLFVGYRFGRTARSSTVSALKVAACFWSAVIGLLLGLYVHVFWLAIAPPVLSMWVSMAIGAACGVLGAANCLVPRK